MSATAPLIQARGLTKRFGSTLAVDDLSFTVEPGTVTGFLGPNGAGKSTTLHLMLGLVRGGGHTLFDGRPYRELACPMRVVGAMLEARAFHPRRSARNHLRMLAAAARVSDRRVDQLLEEVGLSSVAHRRAGGFSLGMAQRLGLAAAAAPRAGRQWPGGAGLQSSARRDAAVGRPRAGHRPWPAARRPAHRPAAGPQPRQPGAGPLTGRRPAGRAARRPGRDRQAERRRRADRPGLDTRTVGELAHQHRLRLHELASRAASLEAAFLELVGGEVDHLQAGAGRP